MPHLSGVPNPAAFLTAQFLRLQPGSQARASAQLSLRPHGTLTHRVFVRPRLRGGGWRPWSCTCLRESDSPSLSSQVFRADSDPGAFTQGSILVQDLGDIPLCDPTKQGTLTGPSFS